MTEYAIISGGSVVNMVTSSRSAQELAGMYPPGTEVVPVDEVSAYLLERYEFWGRRP